MSSLQALKYAASMAQGSAGQLTVLHVVAQELEYMGDIEYDQGTIMWALRRALALTALALTVALTGCSLPMRPVRVEATAVDWKALAGEWRGEFWMSAYDRHGLITFRLAVGPDGASGEVLMISDRFAWPYLRDRVDPTMKPGPFDRTQLLTILFVRAEDGSITGRIDRFRDPDRRCDAEASFRGSVDGDTIHGTVSSICVGDIRGGIIGRWTAERKPAVTAR